MPVTAVVPPASPAWLCRLQVTLSYTHLSDVPQADVRLQSPKSQSLLLYSVPPTLLGLSWAIALLPNYSRILYKVSTVINKTLLQAILYWIMPNTA